MTRSFRRNAARRNRRSRRVAVGALPPVKGRARPTHNKSDEELGERLAPPVRRGLPRGLPRASRRRGRNHRCVAPSPAFHPQHLPPQTRLRRQHQRRRYIASSSGASTRPSRPSTLALAPRTAAPMARNTAEATKISVNSVSKIGAAAPAFPHRRVRARRPARGRGRRPRHRPPCRPRV